MALGAAMVDQARIYEKRPVAGGRVEGTTRLIDYAGPWIKARMTIPPAPEASDQPPRGRRRVPQVPTVMMLAKDKAGNLVKLTTEHRLGVLSKQQFGDGVEVIFEVTADPEPIRKKRAVIGWQVAVRRVVDHEPAQVAS